jgi:hypothetical protein
MTGVRFDRDAAMPFGFEQIDFAAKRPRSSAGRRPYNPTIAGNHTRKNMERCPQHGAYHPRCRRFDSLEAAVVAICALRDGRAAWLQRVKAA